MKPRRFANAIEARAFRHERKEARLADSFTAPELREFLATQETEPHGCEEKGQGRQVLTPPDAGLDSRRIPNRLEGMATSEWPWHSRPPATR